MTLTALETADLLRSGALDIDSAHPFSALGPLEEVADGVGFVPSFANVSALTRLHTAVYSHGHIDHVLGVPVFEAEAAENGWEAPRVVAHEALPLPRPDLPRPARALGRRAGPRAHALPRLHDETVAMMNVGARLDDIVHTVRAPAQLLDRPYLRPV